MYTVTAPRTAHDAIAAFVPEDADYTLRRLLDAIRVLPQFQQAQNISTANFVKKADPKQGVIGNLIIWDFETASGLCERVFGDEAISNLCHLIATYRKHPVPDLDDVFLLRIALVAHGGVTQDEQWTWWTRGDPVSLHLAAGWIGAWGKDSLNACVLAGMGADELKAVLDSGTLPDPEGIELLAALRRRAD